MPKSRGRTPTKRRPKPASTRMAAPPSKAARPRPAALLSDSSIAELFASAQVGTDELTNPAARPARPAAVTAPAPGSGGRPGHPDRQTVALPPSARLQIDSCACEPLKDAGPQSLGVTYWFDAPATGDASHVDIRLTGRLLQRRTSEDGKDSAAEPGRSSFEVTRRVEIRPGSGRTAVTTRVAGLAAGQWEVHGTPAQEARPRPAASGKPPALRATGASGYGPVVNVRAPGARLGAWPALVSTGAVVALITQWIMTSLTGLPALRVFLISLAACLIGLVGAKVYYVVTHRSERPPWLTAGMCIQGFVIGAIGAIAIGSLMGGLPLGSVLDASTPGLLFGMSIGRLGCFFGGCCTGRPSVSRWALWSSDRSIGTRRIPVQLIESSMSALVGVGALIAVVWARPDLAGSVFAAAIAANTLGRQVLFPLRSLPRATAYGRTATIGGSVLVIVAVAIAAAT